MGNPSGRPLMGRHEIDIQVQVGVTILEVISLLCTAVSKRPDNKQRVLKASAVKST